MVELSEKILELKQLRRSTKNKEDRKQIEINLFKAKKDLFIFLKATS